MRVWLRVEEIEVEISDKAQHFSPDVLLDWCHQANDLMVSQRACTLSLEGIEDSSEAS